MNVYVETSVWSFALAEDVPDYRRDTEHFFERCKSGALTPFISEVVIEEIDRAREEIQERLLQLVQAIGPIILPVSSRADELAAEFLQHGAVPPSKPEDASHVAYAFAAGMDVLVSWNFRHIANVRRAQRFNAIAQLLGYTKPVEIVSPAELSYDDE